jgi:hypothetical protein
VTHFEWGFVGALSANLLRLFSFIGQPPQNRRAIIFDPLYIFQFFALPFVGGWVANAYGEPTCQLPGILPLHIGASAPALMKLMSGAVPYDKERTH